MTYVRKQYMLCLQLYCKKVFLLIDLHLQLYSVCNCKSSQGPQIRDNRCLEISYTPARTHFISGLKSLVLKSTFFSLKVMVKSGLEVILKLTEPFQRYLLTCQANSALLGRFFCTGQQQLWRGSVNFKIDSRPHFTIIFKLKNVNFKTRDFSPLIEWVLAGVMSSYVPAALLLKFITSKSSK